VATKFSIAGLLLVVLVFVAGLGAAPATLATSSHPALRYRVIKHARTYDVVRGHHRTLVVYDHARHVNVHGVPRYQVVRRHYRYVLLRRLAVPAAPGPTPTLVWSDEFNGPAGGVPNPDNWQMIVDCNHGDNELEYYTARSDNVGVSGQGCLALTALHEPYDENGYARDFTSGEVRSIGKFATTYGSIQARIKLPAGQGLWPAFWACGDDQGQVGWPQCGEIDIMENLGQDPFTIYGSVHGPTTPASAAGYYLTTVEHSTVSLSQGFHVYGVEWSPNRVQLTLDGVPYVTYTPSSLLPSQEWVFDKPFYLILNLAVGGRWPGPPNASTKFPAVMLVDWVRVCRL
jgi:beta-glucanase (GH16 family)